MHGLNSYNSESHSRMWQDASLHHMLAAISIKDLQKSAIAMAALSVNSGVSNAGVC